MPGAERRIVVVGTGGTIAGIADEPGDDLRYAAARLGVAQLVATVPELAAVSLECEQLAQIDSKDMDDATWQRLALRAAAHLQREEVAGIVVTHGTDTIEESAFFLQRVLEPAKPVVLAGAMRPASSRQADGPRNLLDAVRVAGYRGARGVVVVMDRTVHAGDAVRKVHTSRFDAFDSGEAGPVARFEGEKLRCLRDWPTAGPGLLACIGKPVESWPRVEIVMSHAGVSGAIVRALVAHEATDGIVVAGTGNATVHRDLEQALLQAQAQGVQVRRATRCAFGPVTGRSTLPLAGVAGVAQARIELLLELLACTDDTHRPCRSRHRCLP